MKSWLRTLIKHLVSIGLYYSGLVKLYSWYRVTFGNQPEFVILMYHRVLPSMANGDTRPQPGMVTTQSTFAQQVSYCRRHGDVIHLETLADYLEQGQRPTRPAVIITFDDGWKDNYQYAYPVLRSHSAPATIFLATDYIESDSRYWFHTVNLLLRDHHLSSASWEQALLRCTKLDPETRDSLLLLIDQPDMFIERLKNLEATVLHNIVTVLSEEFANHLGAVTGKHLLLSWNEIAEMQQHGIAFGSHTCSHAILPQLSPEQQVEEIRRSRTVIEEKTGAQITTFAYPNTDYDEQVKQQVQEAGYRCACAGTRLDSDSTSIDIFALPRLGMHEGTCEGLGGSFSRAIFACYLAGVFGGGRR